MNYEELVKQILEQVGTRDNVTSVTNCMTRLRIKVKDEQAINSDALKSIKGVLGIVHDRDNYVEVVVGPGKSSKCGEVCRQMGIPAADAEPDAAEDTVYLYISYLRGKLRAVDAKVRIDGSRGGSFRLTKA